MNNQTSSAEISEHGNRGAALPSVRIGIDRRVRQLVSTLCWIACGRNKRLDDELSSLIRLMNSGITDTELDTAVSRLAGIVGDAPSPSRAEPATPVPTQDKPLLRLLDGLTAIPPLNKQLLALRRLAYDGNNLGEVAEQAGSLVHRHCADLETERASLIGLLDQMTTGLSELSIRFNSDTQLRQEANDQSRELNRQLLGEVQDLGTNVGHASDLKLLQEEIRKGLDRINANLQETRAREEARMQELEARAQEMKAQIEKLESETQKLRESVAHEHKAACTDRLTTLPNRFAYDVHIKQEQQHCHQADVPLVLVVWDIDRFKTVNDSYGHHAGDKALQVIGQHLAQHLRPSDFCARYGGEEFVMTLRGLPIDQALAAADRLRESVEKISFHFRQQPVTLTVSSGLTLVTVEDTPESAFERADAALYMAKNTGRNCCRVG